MLLLNIAFISFHEVSGATHSHQECQICTIKDAKNILSNSCFSYQVSWHAAFFEFVNLSSLLSYIVPKQFDTRAPPGLSFFI